MNQHPYKPGLSKQRGVVVMIMLVIMVMGSAYFLIAALNKGDARQPGNIAATAEIGAVTDALIGYAIAHGQCLPCPDTTGDGIANAPCGTGALIPGKVPWATLGLGALDNWGRRLRYVVDSDFTGSTCTTYPSNIQSDIVVKGRDATGTPIFLTTPANNPPAVVISHGNNGFGGTNEVGMAMPNPPANNFDEITNSTATTNLMQRVASDTAPAAIGGPFDDLVGWVDRVEFQTQLEKIYPAW